MDKVIIALLEELAYWETCPDSYKEKIPKMVEYLKEQPTCSMCGDGFDNDSVCGSCHANN